MTKYKILNLLLLSFFIFSFLSCKDRKKTEEETVKMEVIPDYIVEMRADQVKLANIVTGNIEMRSLSDILKVNGLISVAPQNLATVCAPMSGFIKSTTLMPGNAVRKGQILAILQNQEFVDLQQSYLEAKNKFVYAESEYNRQKELYKNDVSSEKNLQQVTTEYKNLRAQVRSYEQKLSLIGIQSSKLKEEEISSSILLRSPISGYITTVNINLGKYITSSDVLFEIVNTDKLVLKLTLFEKDARKVSKGQKIRFFINNETEQHEAIITQTGQSVNADKTYSVYASVAGKCKNVLPGMYVNALIETSGKQVLSLPTESVISFEDKDYIFIFEKNKQEGGQPFTEYRMIEVRKGVSDNGFIEVLLPEDFNWKKSKVVVKGAYNLLAAKKNAGEMAC